MEHLFCAIDAAEGAHSFLFGTLRASVCPSRFSASTPMQASRPNCGTEIAPGKSKVSK